MPDLTTTKLATRHAVLRSKPEVRLAVHEDFEDIVRLADSTRSPTAPSLNDKLARHFSVPWQANNSPGYVLVQGRELVGFLASLTHTREMQGELHTIRNLGSWFVNTDYRRHSLTLVREALRSHEITYTAVSPIARVARIIKHFGFQTFESHGRTIYPFINLRSVKPRPTITVGDVSSLLPPALLKIFDDHKGLPCEHAVLEQDGRLCYFVFVRKFKRFRSSATIHYLSDPGLFRRCIHHVVGRLCRKLGVTSVIVNNRFLGDAKIPLSKRRRLEFPLMFRSDSLGPADIDNLYSERVVMGF